jgi:hypothetical protein
MPIEALPRSTSPCKYVKYTHPSFSYSAQRSAGTRRSGVFRLNLNLDYNYM